MTQPPPLLTLQAAATAATTATSTATATATATKLRVLQLRRSRRSHQRPAQERHAQRDQGDASHSYDIDQYAAGQSKGDVDEAFDSEDCSGLCIGYAEFVCYVIVEYAPEEIVINN